MSFANNEEREFFCSVPFCGDGNNSNGNGNDNDDDDDDDNGDDDSGNKSLDTQQMDSN